MEREGMYEPLASSPEDGLEGQVEPPPPADLLDSEEGVGWDAVPNLDQFFTRIYRYWEAKGFAVMLLSRLLNLAALGFTVAMSALLLLYVKWGALQAECLRKDTCDLMEVAFRRHPLEDGLTFGRLLAVLYIAAFSAFWVVAAVQLVAEVREMAGVRHFVNHKLGLSERQLATCTWPEVAHRLVQVQRTTRLCIVRDLSEHDVVSRIMRKENYLIAMLNKGVLGLSVPIPGLRHQFLLPKTLEWNLYWCVLDSLFDDHFRLRRTFLYDEHGLKWRLRVLAAINLAASPFMLLFLLIYFFMKNAEKFYHHPSTIGARRWSPLAKWRLREFNELPHFITHRLNASHAAAERYIQQFPNHALSHIARFIAFVSGSFAALLLALALIDERLLERDLLGRQIVWWVATVGMVLALSRSFIIESVAAFDPEAALMDVVAHTHHLPRHWRGRAHSREVQEAFTSLFQYKAVLLLEELASTLLTPFVLAFSLPQCAGAILRFVEENTVHVEGVGDVCSLAAFDFARHGNAKYGAPVEALKAARSRQGKLEKSFLSFAAAYPQWEPPEGLPRAFLGRVASQALLPKEAAAAASVLVQPGGSGTAGSDVRSALLLSGLGTAGGHCAPGQPAQQPLLGQSLFASQLHPPPQHDHHSAGWHAHANAEEGQQAAAGPRVGVPAAKASGIFASAELADAATASAANGQGHGGTAPASHLPRQHYQQQQQQGLVGRLGLPADAAERVALSQLLLQSIYEEQEEEGEQRQRQHAAIRSGHPLEPVLAAGPRSQQQQVGFPLPSHPVYLGAGMVQHSRDHLQQQQQQYSTRSRGGRQNSLVGRLQGAGQHAAPSGSPPRQTWQRQGGAMGPSPGRVHQLSSELSVLSREPSSVSEAPPSPSPALHTLEPMLGIRQQPTTGDAGMAEPQEPQASSPQLGAVQGEAYGGQDVAGLAAEDVALLLHEGGRLHHRHPASNQASDSDWRTMAPQGGGQVHIAYEEEAWGHVAGRDSPDLPDFLM